MFRILLTGGGGFIGSHLAEEFLGCQQEVTILDLDVSRNVSHLDCEKVQANVQDRQVLVPVLEQKDAVIHLAAVSRVEWGQQRPFECVNTNILGTMNVLEAIRARGISPLFVLASSREVYGEPTVLPVAEEHSKNPISIYGGSKLAAETLTRTYCEYFRLPYVILRLSNTYGSGRDIPERVTPRFMKAALSGSPLIVNGGNQRLDFTYINDVVHGISVLVESFLHGNENLMGQDLNFATGKGTTLLELARLIKDVCGSKSEIEVRESRSFDVQNFVGDPSKTRKLLGIQFTVDLRRGIEEYSNKLKMESV